MPDVTHDAPPPDRTSVQVRATGRVQGVFFRASTRDLARKRGVCGWVRNDRDGAVTAHLEGPPDAVAAVVAWIEAGGPPHAAVEDVTTRLADAEGHANFTIRH